MAATKAVKRAEENIMKRGGILSPDAENRMPLFERMAGVRHDTAINAAVTDCGGNTCDAPLQLPDMTDEEREVLLAGTMDFWRRNRERAVCIEWSKPNHERSSFLYARR